MFTRPAKHTWKTKSLSLVSSAVLLLAMVGIGMVTEVVSAQAARGGARLTAGSPGLLLTKTVSPAAVSQAGQVITYSFTLQISQDVGGLSFADPIGSGGFTASGAAADSSLWDAHDCIGQIDGANPSAGDSISCEITYTVTQADIDSGATIDNQATVTGTVNTAGDTTATSQLVHVAVTQNASIKITDAQGTLGGQPWAAGSTIDYSFTVQNTGDTTLTTVGLRDLSGILTTVTCAPATPATLAPSATMTCTAQHQLTAAEVAADQIVVRMQAFGTPPSSYISATGIPQVTDERTVTITGPAADKPSISLTFNRGSLSMTGSTITFVFIAQNTGNVVLHGVNLTQVSFNGIPVTGSVACAADTLDPNQTTTCTVRYTIQKSDCGKTITATAVVQGLSPGGVAVTDNASGRAVLSSDCKSCTPSPKPTPHKVPVPKPTPQKKPAAKSTPCKQPASKPASHNAPVPKPTPSNHPTNHPYATTGRSGRHH